MRGIGALRILIAFVILVVLHFTLRPMLGWRAAPDFLVIAVLLAAIRVRPGAAALVGFAVGIIWDSLALHAFGAAALAMSAIAFAASWLKAVFFADNVPLNAFFFFLGKWAFDILYLAAERRIGGGELAMQFLVWSPLSAAVTAIAGLGALVLLRPVLRTTAA